MRIDNDPHGPCEGKKWLSLLQNETCLHFRTYTDYIRSALSTGRYTQEDLGASEEEVLELAVCHAAKAAKASDGYPAEMALLYHYQGQLGKVKGAHRPPIYAQKVTHLQEEREKRAA